MTLTTTEHKYVQLDERGIPIIAGTTMKITELIEAQMAYGWSPEEIHFQHPYLSMSQIHSSLAYYWDHKAEIDADIEQRFEYAEGMRKQAGSSPLAARLRAQGLLK
ncbi:DUF433 domain-containing protein [Nostoc sp. MG11]|uniref:DUF433 domain-containing protein n=1 Tax=Nostoc sp. MG11 TaxID=2721166 RepID=UPI001867992C|nr:DUF433 domain-containing protein [Nostoc sp. MG11]